MPKKTTIKSFKLHPAQEKIHNSKARFKVLCCGRRFGKTKYASRSLFEALYPMGKVKVKPKRVWVVAPTAVLTREVEEEFYQLIKPLIEKRDRQHNIYYLYGGHKVEFRSADSKSLKGAGLDLLIIDEAADVPDIRWQQELRPTLIDTKGCVIIISTPEGRNWFWDVYCKGQDPEYSDYESWNFSSYANPFLDKDELDSLVREMPELLFRQEIMAEFLDDASAFFRKVDEAIYYGDEPPEKEERRQYKCQNCHFLYYTREDSADGASFCPICKTQNIIPFRQNRESYFIGVDLAREIDFTVITVVKYSPFKKKLRIVEIDRFNNIDWETQKARISAIYNKYRGFICMDGTGLGGPIVEALAATSIPVDGIKFSNEMKLKLHSKLAVRFEQGQIEIPNNAVLVNELKSFQAERTPGGVWKLGAPDGQHDDCVTSLALAVWNTPVLEGEPNEEFGGR